MYDVIFMDKSQYSRIFVEKYYHKILTQKNIELYQDIDEWDNKVKADSIFQ